MRAHPAAGEQRGSMLVMALWALTLLVLFSLSLGFGVRQKAALLSRLTSLDAVYPIAYSGVEAAKSLVQSDDNAEVDTLSDPWAVPMSGEEMGQGSFSVLTDGSPSVVDEERKVNLNKTSVEIAARLFERVSGLGKENANELVYGLLDWMDSDSAYGHPQYGAEDRHYEGLRKPYSSKDAPYETLDEALLVKGMTPELFEKIRPYVTVFGSGRVNVNTARREVLTALGFSEAGVEILAQFRSGPDGKEGTTDDRFFTNVTTIAEDVKTQTGTAMDISQTVLIEGLLAADRIGVASSVFSVTSRGQWANGASLEVHAVFNRKGQVLDQRSGEVQWPAR